VDTYLHLAGRVVESTTRWRVCERCDAVIKRRRSMRHSVYRCPTCERQRVPSALAPSPYRECWRCGGLFEPSNRQQTSCPDCRKNKSALSRYPGRPVTSNRTLRRATVDFPEPGAPVDKDDRLASVPATDEWVVHTWADPLRPDAQAGAEASRDPSDA
jgi:hypothetical protein